MIKERIIHQVWVGPNPAPEEWMKTWRDKHPGWLFMRWGDEEVDQYPFVNKDKIEDLMKRGIYHGASDVIGYELLYEFGGFIAPADSKCLNPIDELMDIEEDCFTCYENERKTKKLLSLHFAASKGCLLMNEAITELRLRTKVIKEPWISTGNLFITKIVSRLNYPIKIYPSHYFIPVHYSGVEYKGTDKIYAEHFWGTTRGIYKNKI